MPTSATIQHILAFYAHLTDRDRAILAVLDEHRVLTSDQIRRLHFHTLRTCQKRLKELHHLGLLDRFRYARTGGGADPWHWVLGLHGARYMAGIHGRPMPSERSHRDHILRLSGYVTLAHLRTTNEFGIRLACAGRLDRWWSERTATARFLRIRPDAHGIWRSGDVATGWFLECDMGTESLPKLIAKLDAYQRLATAGGPTYPVLFWLPSLVRENNLQQLLRRHRPDIPVATATHDADPAGPVWLPADRWQRITLAELPSDHGRDSAENPNWVDGHLDLSADGAPPG